MTVVKELNELAKKMTGVNPGAKTDAQALNYIEQHYEGGDTPTPQSKYDYIIPSGIYDDVSGEITNQDVIAVLEEINENYLDEQGKPKPLKIGIYMGNQEQHQNNVFTEVLQIKKEGDKVGLLFTSTIDTIYHCLISYYDDAWRYNSIG